MSHSVRSRNELFYMKKSCPFFPHPGTGKPLPSSISDVGQNLQKNTKVGLGEKSHVDFWYDLPGLLRQTHLEWSLNICWLVCAKVYCTWRSEHSPCPRPCSFNEGWKELWQKGTPAGLSLGCIATGKLDGKKQRRRWVSSPFPLITEQQHFISFWNGKLLASLNMYVP